MNTNTGPIVQLPLDNHTRQASKNRGFCTFLPVVVSVVLESLVDSSTAAVKALEIAFDNGIFHWHQLLTLLTWLTLSLYSMQLMKKMN